MKLLLHLILIFVSASAFCQETLESNEKFSLLLIKASPNKHFHHNYLLFIPKKTPKDSLIHLLVEPNNTGEISDSISVHQKSAIHLASVASVGNNISTELNIPLLVPIFPRPESNPLVYTHALDRDIILEKTKTLKRLDLQLLAMIKDAKTRLQAMDIKIYDKFFMNGFSASASFTNRFLFIHPEKVKAAAMGGLNGALMLPLKQINNNKLNYPLGINDFKKRFKTSFDFKNYLQIPQYIYMGKLDSNDAVQFDDAYNLKERNIINSNQGFTVQTRWNFCQKIYEKQQVNVKFETFENVGHWTTGKMNLATILFFYGIIKGE
ncbi:MAG: hypothetical protein ACPGSD_11990 [Flavobacteriales bacterium]